MNNRQKSKIIIKILNKTYPKVPIPLNYKNTFTLLISVLLSAQCTDVNVNNVTKRIYPKYNKPEHFVKLGRKKIESLIKKIGIFRIKAKSIFYLSKTLIDQHGGKVPKTYEDLEKLPGVGHKTASVVMSQAFGVPAFPVDTHIHRLMYRWGFSSGKNVLITERDAKRLFPKDRWNDMHIKMIWYGREYSPARGWRLENDPITKKMSFEPIVGSTYYLYFSKKENRNILSMIGPSEWGKSKNELKFIAEVTLLADRTWEIVKMDESFTFDNF